MESLKNYIYKQVASQNISQAEAKQMLLELKEKPQGHDEEIAIIGMSGRFPKAKNLEEYWDNIRDGRICIDELPKSRIKDTEAYLLKFHHKELVEENAIREDGHLDLKYETRGFLDEIDKFDAAFFGIPPREARTMDPDQRMFLEVAYEAIEDAGYCGDRIYGTNTGVFVGLDHVSELKYKQIAISDPMVVTGTWPSILSSRISYIFNLHGPSIVIDTACSSGLVSVHTACSSIRNGECEMAIVGGLSSFNYRPKNFKSQLNELDSVESSDNTVKTFDKKANGTVWGEGLGAVVLKSLSKALADGDPIHAVIKASAINNDGASNGITAPDAGAQERLLVNVWKKARINPESVEYVEAHGTGTVLGDPIEIKAMTNAFRAFTDKRQFCGVGSVKTNIGHLVAASGLASLLKVVMMLKNKSIPPSNNFTEPNPYINFTDSPVYISDRLRRWQKGESPRRAGINSFGFSGTNCHVLLEEAPQRIQGADSKNNDFEIFTASARNQQVLKQIARNLQREFSSKNHDISDVCYTSNTGRGHYNCRIVMLVKDFEDLQEKINYIAETDFNELNKFGVYFGEHRIAPDNKTVREKGEITEGERRKMSRAAEAKLSQLLQNYSYPAAAELCDLYVKGAKVEWKDLYNGQGRRRINLPYYPLERVRYWFEDKSADNSPSKETDVKKVKEFAHPLVDICLAESLYQDIYMTEFSVDRHWVLKDHKIMGNYVIPGTTYIEMAVEISKKYYGSSIEIKDIIYLTPAIVKENETREIHTILSKQKGHIDFTFASRINPRELDEQWIRHAEFKVCKLDEIQEKVSDIKDIERKLNSEKGEDGIIDTNPRESVITLGQRWHNDNIVAVGKSEALVELGLPESIVDDIGKFNLHVAMLDNAVNAISQRIGKGLYLPFFYKSLKVYGKMPGRFHSHIRVNEKILKGMETVTFDVSLIDEGGRVFAEVSDYSIKKVRENEFNPGEMTEKGGVYFEIAWVGSEPDDSNKDIKAGSILVLTDRAGYGAKLAERLRADGCSVIEAEEGGGFEKLSDSKYRIGRKESDYRALFSELSDRNLTSILHMMTLSRREVMSLEDIEDEQELGTISLLYLTKALVACKYSKDIEILLVSDHANEVSKREKVLKPMNSAFLGMGKIIALEHENIKCRGIDIDEATGIECILHEMKAQSSTYMSCYRGNKRFVEELRKVDLEKVQGSEPVIRENGVYIITGGMGGLGLEIGKYLSGKNKVKIALINRSEMPERVQWDSVLAKGEDKKLCRAIGAVRQIEQSGSEVSCYSADVADLHAMEDILNNIRSCYGAINGVIHCAGIAGDGFMMFKEKEMFERAVSPKIKGTWLLDSLTDKDELDFFVMFSSILSIFSDPGQGDYTAANSFLDSFAALRSRKGKRTIAINWPAWKETGMAADYGIREGDTPVLSVSTAKALRYFEEILGSQTQRVMPGELNSLKLVKSKEGLRFRLSDQIEGVLEKHKARLVSDNKQKVLEESNEKTHIKGRVEESYNDTEGRMAQIWSNVLGLEEIDIFDSFSSLGGDSMMAIQLLKEVNKIFEGAIDISDVFSYPSVQQMSAYIDEKLGITKAEKKASREEDTEITDDSIKTLLDGLESGETSIENALKILGGN